MATFHPPASVASLVLLTAVQMQPVLAEPVPRELSVACSAHKDWCDLLAKKYQEEFDVAVGVKQNMNTPVPRGAPRFSEFKIYLAYDPKKFAAPDEKRRLTARWENEVLKDVQRDKMALQ